MTRTQLETPVFETTPQSPGSPVAASGDASDTDTQRPTVPKGSGIGAVPKPGALPSNEGGDPDTGSGGGPKSGLEAEPKTDDPGAKGGSSS